MDDNFASIVKGIEEGRLIFSNLKKSIAYTLTSNIPEIVPFLVNIVLQIPLGLTTIMILCIDLGTDILPAISFAYEKAEADIMKIAPRNRHVDKLVTPQLVCWSYVQIGIIQAFAAFTTFFFVLNREGFSTDFIMNGLRAELLGTNWNDEGNFDPNDPEKNNCYYNDNRNSGPAAPSGKYGGDFCADKDYRETALKRAQTAFLASIVICQIGCGIAAKTRLNSIIYQGFGNMVFNYGLVQETLLIVILVYAPGIQTAFGTLNMRGPEWLIPIPFSLLILLYDEFRKWVFRNYPDSDFKKYFYF